ncbi:hypothetical protein C5167_039863 [Papaver somniferum]|uniref:RING-type E3 ubiquitin transferase n=1 Tax=Papaver somniferum TaxID=3469 RepID=A0A4Y7IHK2_PAPSO|nr:E3 ubiquitin-protein ligase ATL9-like [Papaver somniferum]RZC46925.1 hypothetical protein C5167_039863 [Papaver somniferum]
MVKKNINLTISAGSNSINSVFLLLVLILPYTSAQSDTDKPRQDNTPLFYFLIAFTVFMIISCIHEQRKIRNNIQAGDPAVVPTETPSIGGLDSAVIETFPVFVYSDVKNVNKVHNIKGAILECPVCLSEFGDKDKLRLLPCHHVFHPECIGTWFVSNSTCPYCCRDLKTMVAGSAISAGDAIVDVYEEDEENHSEATVHSETEHGETWVSIPLVQNSEQVINGINPDNEKNLLNAGESTLRSTNGPIGKYPRSHSTGHSSIPIPRDLKNSERFTLRLPDDVRKDILRQKSFNFPPVSGGSSHRVHGGSGGAGSINRRV